MGLRGHVPHCALSCVWAAPRGTGGDGTAAMALTLLFSTQMVNLLLNKGASLSTCDKKDRQPIHWAAFLGRFPSRHHPPLFHGDSPCSAPCSRIACVPVGSHPSPSHRAFGSSEAAGGPWS